MVFLSRIARGASINNLKPVGVVVGTHGEELFQLSNQGIAVSNIKVPEAILEKWQGIVAPHG